MAVALVPLSADIAVTVGSRQAGLVVKDTRFDPGLQLASELRLGVGGSLDLTDAWEIQLDGGASVGTVRASANRAGVVYRGLTTRSLWLTGALLGQASRGLAVTLLGGLASYELSSLIAVHGEVQVAPLLTTTIAGGLSIRWSIPLSYQFRDDLQYSFGLGLRADLRVEISAQ